MSINRNQPCTCGSGKRYKHCCGADISIAKWAQAKDEFTNLMQAALAAQQSAKVDEADRLYTAALALQPKCFDALHMLGVLRLQTGAPEEALRLLLAALPHRPENFTPYSINLKLSIVAVIRLRGLHLRPADGSPQRAFWQFSRPGTLGPLPDSPPWVSVLLRPAEHLENLSACARALIAQTYRPFEVLVLDEGMTDAIQAALHDPLSTAGIPVKRFAAKPLCLADNFDRALNLAEGDYVTYLDAQHDRYTPQRLEYFVRMLENSAMKWGFSNIDFLDHTGSPMAFDSRESVANMMRQLDRLYANQTVLEAFLDHFPALYLGNLFFDRALWSKPAVPDDIDSATFGWAMSLRFGLETDPAYLDVPVFEHRVEEGRFSKPRQRTDFAEAMLLDWYKSAPAVPHITEARAAFWHGALEMEGTDGTGHGLVQLLRLAARLGFAVPGVGPAHTEVNS